LHKAVFSNTSSQANIRQPRAGSHTTFHRAGLSQLRIRGWKQSRVATDPDGGVLSMINYLERKATPDPRSAAAGQRLKISKVCATPRSRGHRRFSCCSLATAFSFPAQHPPLSLGPVEINFGPPQIPVG
jgi:hypothetical protein